MQGKDRGEISAAETAGNGWQQGRGCAVGISHTVDASMVPVARSERPWQPLPLRTPRVLTTAALLTACSEEDPVMVTGANPSGLLLKGHWQLLPRKQPTATAAADPLERKRCCVASESLFCHPGTGAAPQSSVHMPGPEPQLLHTTCP